MNRSGSINIMRENYNMKYYPKLDTRRQKMRKTAKQHHAAIAFWQRH
jgi:hypothetical protein